MQSIDTFFPINYLAAKSLSILRKKKPFFRKCEGREKSSAGRPQIYFFLISFWEIFSFLLYFLYNLCFYFILVFLTCLFFSIKYIYSDTHLTVRAGDIFPRQISGNKTALFFGLTTRYSTRVQRTSCLQIIFWSGKFDEYLIVLDFLWKKVNILKTGSSNFHSIYSSYEIIVLFLHHWLSRYCEFLYKSWMCN